MATLEHFEDLCKAHDWWYVMTDDRKAWKRGQAERDEIHRVNRELLALGLAVEADKILQKYMP